MRRFVILVALLGGLMLVGFLMNTVFKRPPPPGFERHGADFQIALPERLSA